MTLATTVWTWIVVGLLGLTILILAGAIALTLRAEQLERRRGR